MTVVVNSVRNAVEISWDPAGYVEAPPEETPPGYPAHPIYRPDLKPDHTLPGDLPHPDHGLPEPEQPVDPGYGVEEGAHPEHPIYLPPYVDNSLPGPQPHPEHPIVLPDPPPELLPPDKWEALKAFLLGNLPPFDPPDYVAPMHDTALAVQVFAQGQDGDWSNTAVMPNDGKAVLTYPEDFSGSSYIEVRALDGQLVDTGTIEVEAD